MSLKTKKIGSHPMSPTTLEIIADALQEYPLSAEVLAYNTRYDIQTIYGAMSILMRSQRCVKEYNPKTHRMGYKKVEMKKE